MNIHQALSITQNLNQSLKERVTQLAQLDQRFRIKANPLEYYHLIGQPSMSKHEFLAQFAKALTC